MRSSVFSLAISAGALFALAAYGAGAARAADIFGGGGCPDAPGAQVFEESKPEAAVEPAPAPDARPQPKRLGAEALEPAVEGAYADAFRVLSADNECSGFFGGPRVAVTVLNEFSRRLRRRTLGAGDVGLLMAGDYTTYRDQRMGASYRLFDEAVVNSNGPFVAAPTLYGARLRVGRFPAASREGRALMLLHELGHLIRGQDGWLLPNDGGDAALSDRNTRTVESRCLGQLLALR